MVESVTDYLSQLWQGISIKAAFAALATIYTQHFLGEVEVLAIYLFFMLFDFVVGALRAKVYGRWSVGRAGLWLRKLATHMVIISLFGWIYRAFFLTSGIEFGLVNWLLFCLIVTEATSVVHHLTRLGLPVPRVVHVVLRALRRTAVRSMVRGIDDPDAERELREALEEEDNAKGCCS